MEVNLTVGQKYDWYFNPATITKIDYDSNKMTLQLEEDEIIEVDIPSVEQSEIRSIPVINNLGRDDVNGL